MCLDYVGKQLYTTVTFHFPSSLWHFFCYVPTTLSMLLLQQRIQRYFLMRIKVNVIITLFLGLSLWDTLYYVTTTFFQVPRKRILNNTEMSCLLVRSNHVRKLDTITLRTGSSFLGYLFVVRLHNILK